jgi:hypothetical protein
VVIKGQTLGLKQLSRQQRAQQLPKLDLYCTTLSEFYRLRPDADALEKEAVGWDRPIYM